MVNNNWQWQELDGQKRPIKVEELDEELPLHKRQKSFSSEKIADLELSLSEYIPFSGPSPLGLKLKKSASLLDLIQKTLSQCNNKDRKNRQVGNRKEFKSKVETADKIKASNFPAALIKIGEWEYVSRHEGDLVAKCYFAKHKIVWEVLDGGLKKKMEIQWADILGLNADFPDTGPSTLTIVLGKKPLFFRELNPQPRKHTLWETTSDFTDGQASIFSRHYLQFAQGVLDKNYEKLIQCDTRLNQISQQQDTVFDLLFEEPLIQAPNGVDKNVSNQLKMSQALLSSEVKTPMIQQSMSISDLMNHIGHCISDKNPSGILPIFENLSGGDNQKDMLDYISQMLLSDTQFLTASDETKIISKVNSLCCLLQEPTPAQTNVTNNSVNGLHGRNDAYTPAGNQLVGTAVKHDCEEEDDLNYVYGFEQDSGISRKDSFMDFLHELPGIDNLPDLVIDISKDDEI